MDEGKKFFNETIFQNFRVRSISARRVKQLAKQISTMWNRRSKTIVTVAVISMNQLASQRGEVFKWNRWLDHRLFDEFLRTLLLESTPLSNYPKKLFLIDSLVEITYLCTISCCIHSLTLTWVSIVDPEFCLDNFDRLPKFELLSYALSFFITSFRSGLLSLL